MRLDRFPRPILLGGGPARVGLGRGLDLVTTNIVRTWPITLCPTRLIVPSPRGVLRTQGGSEDGAKHSWPLCKWPSVSNMLVARVTLEIVCRDGNSRPECKQPGRIIHQTNTQQNDVSAANTLGLISANKIPH